MDQISKAEQLGLPEQLYVLLTDPETGKPKYPSQRVEYAIATAIVWELLYAGAFQTQGNQIEKVNQVIFSEAYLRKAALHAAGRTPIDGSNLIWEIAGRLHPVLEAVGEDMVAKHLLSEEVQRRFVLFHCRVLRELGDARRDAQELSNNLAQAARNIWDSRYDAELAHTHPRLLARLVLLDNNRLLEPMLGSSVYQAARPHLAEIRTYLHDMIGYASSKKTSTLPGNSGCGDSYIYDSGSSFWIDGHDSGHHHGGHDDSHDSDCGEGSDCASDCSGDGGGGDGGCGGCGGCGG